MIKHLIIDLDGTMVDAKDIHYNAFNQAFRHVMGYIIDKTQHDTELCGLPTMVKLDKLGVKLPIDRKEIYCKKQEITADLFNELKPDLELSDILINLLNDGYTLSCASNSCRNTVVIALKRLGIDEYFTSVKSNDDVKKSKPSPEMYYKCMLETGLWVPETLIIEDSQYGIEAIRNSGCHGLIVKNRSDLTYNKISEQLKCLNQIY